MSIHQPTNNGNTHEISLEGEKRLTIVSGDAASRMLTEQPDVVRALMESKVAEEYDWPNIPDAAKRGELYDGFLKIKEVNPEEWEEIRDHVDLEELYPGGYTIGQEIEWTIQDIQKLIEKGHIAIGVMDGNIVSIIGYKLGGKLEDGTPLYEVTKASTFKEQRNQGVYGHLRDEIVQLVVQNEGDNPQFVTATKNSTVIHRISEQGYREISLDDYFELAERAGGGWTDAMKETAHDYGWRAFIYSPLSENMVGELPRAQRSRKRVNWMQAAIAASVLTLATVSSHLSPKESNSPGVVDGRNNKPSAKQKFDEAYFAHTGLMRKSLNNIGLVDCLDDEWSLDSNNDIVSTLKHSSFARAASLYSNSSNEREKTRAASEMYTFLQVARQRANAHEWNKITAYAKECLGTDQFANLQKTMFEINQVEDPTFRENNVAWLAHRGFLNGSAA